MADTQSFNSYDLLKLIALGLMTVDHGGHFLHLPYEDWWRVAGRAAAPIFCFLAGYNGSYRFRSELLIAAAAVTVADELLVDALLPLNILWSILFARMALQRLEKRPRSPGIVVLVCVLLMPLSMLLLDYGMLALLWALWGREVRRGNQNDAYLYGVAASAGSIAYTYIQFSFDVPQMAAACAVFILLLPLLCRFTLRPLKPSAIGRFFSRNALSYYIAHKTLLMLAA